MNKHQKLVQEQFLNNEEAIIKRLKAVYARALKDIEKKAQALQDDINRIGTLYKLSDDADEKAVLLSMQQSKVYQKQYQDALKKQVGSIFDNLQVEEFQAISEYIEKCYEDGFIGTMFDLQGQGIPLCFPLDQEAMVRAVQLDSKISQGLYTRLGEDVKLLKTRIAAEVSRGISTGETFAQVAQQLSAHTNIGMYNAMRIARTEGHRVAVQSSMHACYKAKDSGADVVKQWDSAMDKRTRKSHQHVDGEIRELDEPFSNGLMFPGDPDGAAEEVIHCRCALLQRARWALDEEELETLKERAAYFGLDKAETFEDYKKKYLEAAAVETIAPPPKKEYLTKKKLEQKISELDEQMKTITDPDELAAMEAIKTEYQDKLDKKILAAETKKLKKQQTALQEQLDGFQIDTYSGIWKDDVSTKDWILKQSAISKKKAYFEDKLLYAIDADEKAKWQGLIDSLDDFDAKGAAYADIQKKLNQTVADLKKLQNSGMVKGADDAFSQARKDAAHWFTDANGSTKAADAIYREKSGEVWRAATQAEKDAAYEYTRSYHKFNEPLRGIEYGTNKFLGVGNVDLETIGVNYGGYKKGEVKAQIDALTSILDKSSYDEDIWLQRGCRRDGMDKFFGIDISDFDLPESELAAKLIGTTPTEYGFMSTGVAKGKGLNTSGGVLLNIYAPRGTKMMYVEPFSAFGNGDGRSWDGKSAQSSFGNEAEMLVQRGTKFRVVKVEKGKHTIFVDVEIIEQGV